MNCPKCNASLTKEDLFCTECGTKIKANQETSFFKKKSFLFLVAGIIIAITIIFIAFNYYQKNQAYQVMLSENTKDILTNIEPQTVKSVDSTEIAIPPNSLPHIEYLTIEDATADNPITMPESVELSVGTSSAVAIGFFNRHASPIVNGKFELKSDACMDSTGMVVNNLESKLNVGSGSAEIWPNKSLRFRILLSDISKTSAPLSTGTYICKIGFASGATTYEEKQFFLTVLNIDTQTE